MVARTGAYYVKAMGAMTKNKLFDTEDQEKGKKDPQGNVDMFLTQYNNFWYGSAARNPLDATDPATVKDGKLLPGAQELIAQFDKDIKDHTTLSEKHGDASSVADKLSAVWEAITAVLVKQAVPLGVAITSFDVKYMTTDVQETKDEYFNNADKVY